MCTTALSWQVLFQVCPFTEVQKEKNSAGIHLNGKFAMAMLEGKSPYIKIHISQIEGQIFKKVTVGHIYDECHFHQLIRYTEAESNLLYFWLRLIRVLPAIYPAHDATVQW